MKVSPSFENTHPPPIEHHPRPILSPSGMRTSNWGPMQARLVCMCEDYILILVGKGQVNEGFQVELFKIGVLQFNRLVLEQSISVRIP